MFLWEETLNPAVCLAVSCKLLAMELLVTLAKHTTGLWLPLAADNGSNNENLDTALEVGHCSFLWKLLSGTWSQESLT